jgi:hypothetical protein
MVEGTYYVALPFDRNDEGDLAAGKAQECRTSTAAIRRARSMVAVHAGAVAFFRTGDPKTGEFEPAEVLKSFGEVPAKDALMGYE